MATYIQRFCVRGTGDFPLDMLRYDYCYPASEDAAVLAIKYATDEPRTVELCRTIDRKDIVPTASRWASFGWQVLPETVKAIKR